MKTFAEIQYEPKYEESGAPFVVILRDVLTEPDPKVYGFSSYDSARHFATWNAREINYDYREALKASMRKVNSMNGRFISSIK